MKIAVETCLAVDLIGCLHMGKMKQFAKKAWKLVNQWGGLYIFQQKLRQKVIGFKNYLLQQEINTYS